MLVLCRSTSSTSAIVGQRIGAIGDGFGEQYFDVFKQQGHQFVGRMNGHG